MVMKNELDDCPIGQELAMRSLFKTLKLTSKKAIRKELKQSYKTKNGDIGFIFKTYPEWALVIRRDGSIGKTPVDPTGKPVRVDLRWIGNPGPAGCVDNVGMILRN
jgi:hypothetical protein